jgi:CMP-N,N'-diacetyllegionaminic acid synthase
MTRPEVLALIPARGGSKGIPRKNLIVVGGRPLITHSIDHACRSVHITRVIVSTDDAEIAAVARESGAEVPFMRPPEFAQEVSPDIDVFRHALAWLAEHEGYRPELVVHLRPTGPVRRVALIDDAITRALAHPEVDSLRSVGWPQQTPYKMWRVNAVGYLEPLLRVDGMPEAHSMPRQMLPEVFWQNGYVDVIRARTIVDQASMTGAKILPFVVHEPNYEIDYPESVPVVEEALRELAAAPQGPTHATAEDKRYPV